MVGVWADQGIEDALNQLRTALLSGTAKLRLYQNNVTPTNATVLADLTESTFAGYAAQTITMSVAAAVAAHIASTTGASVSFTITAGTQAVYGWYVTNAAGTRLLWTQRDDLAPVTLASTGINVYTVTLTVSDKDAATP